MDTRPGPRSAAGNRSRPSLARVLAALHRLYGRPEPPRLADPFRLILYENIAYLANDARREEAFRLLDERVGCSPEKILAAPQALLHEIASQGIVPSTTVEKLREIAAITIEEFGGDLNQAARADPKDAIRAMRRFPSIGQPGAEKVLLFSGILTVLALDSNGLRVLIRLGYGEEDRNYARQYRSAQRAVESQLKRDIPWLIEAHQLLRRHGQELCQRSEPACEACPLRSDCAHHRASIRLRT